MQKNFPAEAIACTYNPRLAMRILAYLRRNPRARDTAEGIAKWWVRDDPTAVHRVLQQLVVLNLVRKHSMPLYDHYSAVRQTDRKPSPETLTGPPRTGF